MKYKCPYAERKNALSFLICKYLMVDNINYNIIENATKIFCAHQQYCPETKRAENTINAKKCYEYHSKKG